MSKTKIRLTLASLSALGALLIAPAAGQAATNFGSRLNHDPTDTTCQAFGTCTIASYIQPSDPNGDPYSGGAPVGGVITKFKIRAYAVEDPGQVTFRVADVKLTDPNSNDSALSTATATGPTVTIIPDEAALETPVTEVPARVPVKKGQHLAVDTTKSIGAVYNSNGSKFSYVYSPPLVDGSGARGSNEAANELLVAATIEPDADGDGFGDETQDKCPTQAITQGACDVTPPGVSGFSVTNGEISYTLSEAANVSFKLEKKFVGRQVGKKCAKKTSSNKKKKKCSTFKPVGAAFPGTGAVGANKVTLPNGKKLKPGSYRLTMTARDAVGLETVTVTTFKVAKKKKKK